MMKEKYETFTVDDVKRTCKSKRPERYFYNEKGPGNRIDVTGRRNEKEQEKEKQEKRETVKEECLRIPEIKKSMILTAWTVALLARGILEVMPDGFGLFSEVIIIFQEIIISIFRRLRSVDSNLKTEEVLGGTLLVLRHGRRSSAHCYI